MNGGRNKMKKTDITLGLHKRKYRLYGWLEAEIAEKREMYILLDGDNETLKKLNETS